MTHWHQAHRSPLEAHSIVNACNRKHSDNPHVNEERLSRTTKLCTSPAKEDSKELSSPPAMFYAFSQEASGQHFIAIINGAMADLALEWYQDNPSVPNSLTLSEIPTMRFPTPDTSNLTSAVWIYSSVYLDKSKTGPWKWGPSGSLPPTPAGWTRTFSMSVVDRPVYRCLNMREDGNPTLDLIWCTGTSANIALLSAQVVQVVAMTPLLPSLKRKRASPHFASESCHNDSHNHDEASTDDSGPPPSPQPGPSRRQD